LRDRIIAIVAAGRGEWSGLTRGGATRHTDAAAVVLPVAANVVCALALEGGDTQSMSLGSVVAGPSVELDTAFDIDAVALPELGRNLGGLAEHGDADPLQVVIFADADAQARPRLSGLRNLGLGIGSEEAVESAVDHGVTPCDAVALICASILRGRPRPRFPVLSARRRAM